MRKCAVCGLVLSVALAPAYALTGREVPAIVLSYLMAAMAIVHSLTCYSESSTGAWLVSGEGVC